jgi:hypothetical protein
MTNVLAEPEFSGSEEARRAFRLLEERSLLDDLLSRSVVGSAIGGVHVIIGGEGAWRNLGNAPSCWPVTALPVRLQAHWEFWAPCACLTRVRFHLSGFYPVY